MVTAYEGMVPRAALRAVTAALTAAHCPDAAFDARELLRFVLGTGVDPRLVDTPLSAAQAAALAGYTARRAAREPLQYIVGSWDFMGLRLAVGPGVLCPRPDTETVCEAVLDLLKGSEAPVVWDLCAGTGCLGLAVRHFCPGAQVVCVEKDAAAFAYLVKNTANSGVQAVQADALHWVNEQPENSVDLIVCNPPYLTAAEMDALQPEVSREPAAALYGGADGLDFYRALLRDGLRPLRPGGRMVLEIGAAQKAAVLGLAAQNGWQNPACKRDAAGHDRAITVQKPPKSL